MIKLRLFGIDVTFHFVFFAVVTVYLLWDRTGYGYCGVLAALMHELGHVVMYIALGRKPKEVHFAMEGIRIRESGKYLSPLREAAALSAGCAVNFGMYALLSHSFAGQEMTMMALTHLSLGLFNALPVGALDGGMLLRLGLEQIFPQHVAYRMAFAVSVLCLTALVIGGSWIFFTSGNFTLLITCAVLTFALMGKKE